MELAPWATSSNSDLLLPSPGAVSAVENDLCDEADHEVEHADVDRMLGNLRT